MYSYSKITITLAESVALEHETRQQDISNLWHLARSHQLTSSSFKRICSRRAHFDSHVASIKTTAPGQTKAMKRGVDVKPTAIMQYSEVTGNLVFPCGFVVNHHAPHLDTSPERKVIDRRDSTSYEVLESKCPLKRQLQRLSPYHEAGRW